MIIETKEATVESSMDFGDSIDMGFAADGVVHLMSLLTNLYNDPELAVVREYFTNAQDAHINVGQTKPVDVYLPTSDNPLYVVRDYGVGMSRETIEKIYSQYGASTKRNSNKEAGAFGLGCKSALAIATQFTLTSVKDGLKTTALISKTESGINKVDILPVRPSDEPTGTTVTIPVPNVALFADRVKTFFKFVDPETVLLNGRRPENIYDKSTRLTLPECPAAVYTRSTEQFNYWQKENPSFHLVMGNVPYEITEDNFNEAVRSAGLAFDTYKSELSAVFVADIGSVDLTPNREGLRYTPKTKEFVQKVVAGYVGGVRTAAQEEIDAVESRTEVYAVTKKWAGILELGKTTWRGEDIVYHIKLDKSVPRVRRYDEDAEHDKTTVLDLSGRTVHCTLVYGLDPEEYKKASKWLGSYRNSTGVYTSYGDFLFVKDLDQFDSPWVKENAKIGTIHVDDLIKSAKEYRKKLAAERRKNGDTATAGRAKMEYQVINLQTGKVEHVPYDEIEGGLPYIRNADFGNVSTLKSAYRYDASDRMKTLRQLLQLTRSTHMIILQSGLQASALEKRVDGAYNVLTTLKAAHARLAEQAKRQRVRDLVAVSTGRVKSTHSGIKTAGLLDEILDPEVRRALSSKRKDRIILKRVEAFNDLVSFLNPKTENLVIGRNASDQYVRLMHKYPLMDIGYRADAGLKTYSHIVMYINAVYTNTLTPTE